MKIEFILKIIVHEAGVGRGSMQRPVQSHVNAESRYIRFAVRTAVEMLLNVCAFSHVREKHNEDDRRSAQRTYYHIERFIKYKRYIHASTGCGPSSAAELDTASRFAPLSLLKKLICND